jgi:hypothetical protein
MHPLLKRKRFDLSYNENLNINLNASIIDSTKAHQRRCRTIKSCMHPFIKHLKIVLPTIRNVLGIHYPLVPCKAKRDSQATLPNNSEEGFIGVERKKRPKHKQFFLSCIAESVKKYQIYSYLNTRNVTPNNISTFRSKRI